MTVRQARANRRNSRKSTGPRTSFGKIKASQNAIKHGVFCRHVVLEGESQPAFNKMRQGFINDLSPQNQTQLLLVERIAANAWKCDRLDEAELKCYEFRRCAHACGLEDSATGETMSDSYRVNAFWETLREETTDGDDVTKDPKYLQMCSAMGSAAMTMHSLMGDVDCELERYQMMRIRLEGSTHRALRELRLLQADAKKDGTFGPSPFSEADMTAMEQLARQLDLKWGDEDEAEDQDEEEDEGEDEEEDEEESNAQNEANPEKTTATPDEHEACDEPRAQESALMPENVVVLEETIRQVQDEVAEKLRAKDDDES